MSKVKLGIIGVGNMGSSHIRNYLKDTMPEIEITAVADIKPDRLEWAREQLPEVKTFDSASALMDSGEVEAVLIATPHYDHPPLVIEALNKGLHAMSEKPAGVYTKQVREMNAAADKSDKIFGIMFNQRTNCLYRKAHEIVHSGKFGEMKRVTWIITDWYRTQAYYN
ncbi:MAG: Gfo/Idh/MocA family oxidoreductase, partial [Clostridia bacterium]|nr:Gfo/Idh/MocA family oxidoreductase [Clostridia bacterium]